MSSRVAARRETIGWRAVSVLLLALCAVLIPSAVAAQDGDPYGPTSTTTGPPAESPSCQVELERVRPGDQTTVHVHLVPLGATVRVLIGGEEAGRATAPSAFQSGTVSLAIGVVIPDVDPGDHDVVAVGPGFSATCTGGARVEVLSASDDTRDSGFDVLAFTGLNLLLYLLVAAALVLIGRKLVKMAKRRQAAAA